MRHWMSLTTFIKMMSSLYGITGNKAFLFDTADKWKPFVKSDIAVKTATIVMFDRWSDK